MVPFGTQAIRFFNQHWTQDGGKLYFYPANACEMYWNCTNPTDYISGLSDIPRLLALPGNFTTSALISEWNSCYAALPPLPMDSSNSYVLPAQVHGSANNFENPECYCIFPYRLYGLGLSNLNVGLSTFTHRVIRNNKNCWSQDVIEEALLGLTGDAQTDVVSSFTQKDSQCRFPAFWTSHHDYLPDLDNGGAAIAGLQFMLMQCNGGPIQLLPSWPSGWNVDFKLNAPSNTTVRLVLTNGTVATVNVNLPALFNVGGTLITPTIYAFSSYYNSAPYVRNVTNLVQNNFVPGEPGLSGPGYCTDTHDNYQDTAGTTPPAITVHLSRRLSPR